MAGLVALVVPLRDVARVEKAEELVGRGPVEDAVVFHMRGARSTFTFAQLPDRHGHKGHIFTE